MVIKISFAIITYDTIYIHCEAVFCNFIDFLTFKILLFKQCGQATDEYKRTERFYPIMTEYWFYSDWLLSITLLCKRLESKSVEKFPLNSFWYFCHIFEEQTFQIWSCPKKKRNKPTQKIFSATS